MKNGVKRLLAVLMTATVLFGCLTACGGDGTTDSSSDGTDISSESTEKKTADDVLQASEHLVGVTDQAHNRLVVFDLNVGDINDPDAIVWEYVNDHARYAAGIKFRYNEQLGGYVVLYCGPEGAGIVDYETKEEIFFAPISQLYSNPHSVELLPDGTFFVASTTGEGVVAFDAVAGNKNRVMRMSFPCDAHGVLWDPENEVLWIAGGKILRSYRVTGSPSKPKLTQVSEFTLPTGGQHDLSPVYGDTSKLWVTISGGVIQVDKETGEASKNYRGVDKLGSSTYTPGVGNFPDGTIVYVFPDKSLNDWNTQTIRLFVPIDNLRKTHLAYQSETDHYYKCRVWIADYQ